METTRARPSLFGDIAHGLGFWTDRSEVHEAAAQGRALQLQQLIQGGAAVNIVAVDSITPLHEACFHGQTQCVRLLLDAGAQVDARNIDGSTPLCDACAAGSVECVKLLIEHGATVNPPLFTFSPLHEACMGGNSDCVQVMIDVGALIEAHDCHFGTPLHVACARQHLDCVKVLLNKGANVNAAKLHETALHHAAKVKNVDLIDLLVEFGGNVYAKDNLGKKPIHYTSQGSPSHLCLEFYESEFIHATYPFMGRKDGISHFIDTSLLLMLTDTNRYSKGTPLSLQQISRVALRMALGKRSLEVVSKLELPNRIISYLSYMPPPALELSYF